MKSVCIPAATLCVVLAGCVTTTTGDMPKPASSEDAARLNMDLGISYLRQGDLEQAMRKLEKSIEEQPDNPTAHRALGLVYEAMEDLDGAEKQFRIAVKQAPDDPDALNQLAAFLCLHGQRKEALKYFDRAIAVPRNMGRYVIYTNAGTCAKEEDLAVAENYLRRGLAEQPEFPDALYQMADVAYRRANYLQARAFIDRRLNAGTVGAESLWLAYRIETAMQDNAAARDYAERLLREFPGSVEARLLLESRRNAG